MNALEEKLTRLLADLGDTPDTIAAFLRRQGVKGHSVGPCIIKVLLEREWPDIYVSVGHELAALYDREDAKVMASVVTMPTPVCAFVREWDRGTYPDLIA